MHCYMHLYGQIVRNMTAFDSPLLISKAVCLYARPVDLRQSTFSISEKQLLSLLERRRRKYQSRKEESTNNHLERKDGDSDERACVLGDLGMHTKRSSPQQLRYINPHYVASPPSEAVLHTKIRTRGKMSQNEDSKRSSPGASVTPSSSRVAGDTYCIRETSLLNKYGCSELAEHVVHRAKVRLKRRQKRNLPTLMRSNVDSQTKALPVSYSPSGSKTNTSPIKVTTNERTEASPNNEQKSIRLSVAAAAGQQGSPYFKRMDVPKTAAVRNLGRQLELTESVNSLGSGPVMTRSFKVVYWSDRQSVTPKDTGIPNVPPVTPSTSYSQCFKFVPSLSDVKSQRQLKNRLQDIATKLKQKSDLLNDEGRTKEEEKRKQKEAVTKLKAQQRSEIYALNKIMAEFEEQKFQAFISGKV